MRSDPPHRLGPAALDRGAPAPLAVQLVSASARRSRTAGSPAGDRLPSARALAAQLGVARGTVDAAYELLAGEGAIARAWRRGHDRIPDLRPGVGVPAPAAPDRTAAPARIRAVRRSRAGLPFQRRLAGAGRVPAQAVVAADRAGGAASRRAPGSPIPIRPGCRRCARRSSPICGVARGIVCAAAQVVVTARLPGRDRSARAGCCCAPGDPVWVEDPGYSLARQALESRRRQHRAGAGRRRGDAMSTRRRRAAPDARLAVVTPTHQSAARRRLVAAAPPGVAGLGRGGRRLGRGGRLRRRVPLHRRATLPALKSLDRGGAGDVRRQLQQDPVSRAAPRLPGGAGGAGRSDDASGAADEPWRSRCWSSPWSPRS